MSEPQKFLPTGQKGRRRSWRGHDCHLTCKLALSSWGFLPIPCPWNVLPLTVPIVGAIFKDVDLRDQDVVLAGAWDSAL